MANEAVWNFEPTEKQIEDVRKKWGTLQILTLERYIIGKAGINLYPKVEKAIFFALASIAEKGQYKAEIVGDEYIIKTVLDVVKKYKGKISKIDDIQELLREICYALTEDKGTVGSKKFSRLEKCIRGTSVTEKLRNAVTPQKLIDKREALAQKIEEVCDTINNYFNSENEKGQSYLNDKDMVKLKNEIDSMRSRKYKGKPYNLKKDIDVDSFYRITTIDSAIKTLITASNRIIYKRDSESSLAKNTGGAKDDYFNAYGSAHGGRPITNTHKALLLLISATDKYGNHPLVRRPIVEPFLKSNSLSEIDESRLKQINEILGYTPPSFDSLLTLHDENNPMGVFSKMVDAKNNDFCQNDILFLKKMSNKFKIAYENAIKSGKAPAFSKSEYQDIFRDIFTSQKYLDWVFKGFKASINEERQDREKAVQKVAISGKKGSMDDSLLDIVRNKVLKCETLDEVEDLILYYTTAQGGDLINGFLRGDLSIFRTGKAKLKSSFGTDKTVSCSLLLDTIIKALTLRNTIMYGTIETQTKVYRGLGFEGLLLFLNLDKSSLQKGTDKNLKNIDRLVNYINKNKPIYSTNAITSTTTEQNIAVGHAIRNAQRNGAEFGVVMDIDLNKGTSFGKDFSTTTFGSEDWNKEVILKPQQKINLVSAKKRKFFGYGPVVEIKCQA